MSTGITYADVPNATTKTAVFITGFCLLEQRMSASRARRMRRQPYINAPNMKPMMTLGQYPNFFAIHKFAKTNRAFGRRDPYPRAVNRYWNLT
jgi:hypothetical protein